jgi:checkpoint serine/threonine-protein kinase
MTFHTRAATDEIYSIFNQPLKSELGAGNSGSLCGSDFEDDDYTSAGESATGRISAAPSEFGDDHEITERNFDGDTRGDVTGVSEWTEFTGKHIPNLGGRIGEADGSHAAPVPESEDIAFTSTEHFGLANQDGNNNTSLSNNQTKDGLGGSRFIPMPPEDYNPPLGQYRDATVIAQNRLPFMTPIVEQTESSLGSNTMLKERATQYFKTPSKFARSISSSTPAIPEMDDDDLLLSSPFENFTQRNHDAFGYLVEEGSPSRSAKKGLRSPKKSAALKPGLSIPQVIIDELQCNPMDPAIRDKILSDISPPLLAYPGYFDHGETKGGNIAEIKKFSKSVTKALKNGGAEKAGIPPILSFNGAAREYEIKRELGEGGFAPVYLAGSIDSPDTFSSDSEQEPAASQMPRYLTGRKPMRDVNRKSLEAVKIESEPPSAWEFYMLRAAHARLQSSVYHRTADSIIHAHELHLFKDESILVEDYLSRGTLIDLINTVRNEPNGSDAGLDEVVVMFFAIELFRTIEALHACGIIHGDLKSDNCLVRLQDTARPSAISLIDDEVEMDPGAVHYSPTGAYGWRDSGLTLIDFGRAIDMQAFSPSVQFVADWKIGSHECTEMRECRPWTYQVDLHGLASVIHTMLFGKYMEVVPLESGHSEGGNGSGMRLGGGIGTRKAYRIKESLKRYWEREMWSDVFDLCLNPTSDKWIEIESRASARSSPALSVNGSGSGSGSETDSDFAGVQSNNTHLPVVNSMRLVREKMEAWLVANAARKGLQSHLTKLEALTSRKRAKRGSGRF